MVCTDPIASHKTSILAIDPGEATAFVFGYSDPLAEPRILTRGFWTTDLDTFLNSIIQKYIKEADHVVIEDYRIYPHKARDHIGKRPYAIEVIGMVRLQRHPNTILFQGASQAKQQWPNKRLRRHQIYMNNAHIRDATRHFLTFIENHLKHQLFSRESAI